MVPANTAISEVFSEEDLQKKDMTANIDILVFTKNTENACYAAFSYDIKGRFQMARVYNFSAGPAVLPEEVLKEAEKEMLDYKGWWYERNGNEPSFKNVPADY